MRVFVITGAGISAESGIPTFRGKDGYWRSRHSGRRLAVESSGLDPMRLATPEAFAENPELVWEWYNERRARIRAAEPNPAHRAVAQLAGIADEFLLLTQNVDDLHARAGLPSNKMVQIHGDIFVSRCSSCDFEQKKTGRGGSPEPPVLTGLRIKSGRLGSIAPTSSERQRDGDFRLSKCPECRALMRPGVVWFGEQLDPAQINRVEDFLAKGPCDYVIVVGTTALFGYIVDWAVRAASDHGRLIEVNPEETPLSHFATQVIRESAAVALPRLQELLTVNR